MTEPKANDANLDAIDVAETLLDEVDEVDDEEDEDGEEEEDDDPEEETPQRGEVITSIFRSGKREQLRVVHDFWNGCEFATLRIWFRDPEDRRTYLATRRGVTIRRGEFPQVLAALHEIARRLGIDHPARPTTIPDVPPPA